jgi:pyridoxine 5-phosphate synthase
MAATTRAARGPGHLRLGVNIDHVATIRNARGGRHPDPLRAAHLAVEAGADGITAHLREDRRHISDADIARLKRELTRPLNFEMAATDEMLAIALRHVPHACCLVPEKREEKTTEGGLDVVRGENHLRHYVEELKGAGIRVSLFIEPDAKAIEAAARLGAQVVELHTGAYCDRALEDDAAGLTRELDRLARAARAAAAAGLEVHAGHGLTFNTVGGVARIAEVVELNIGHFLVGEAIFGGLAAAIARMRALMDEARAGVGASAGRRTKGAR